MVLSDPKPGVTAAYLVIANVSIVVFRLHKKQFRLPLVDKVCWQVIFKFVKMESSPIIQCIDDIQVSVMNMTLLYQEK